MRLMIQPGDFLLALGFCTRLAPARMVSGRELAAGLFWFPLVGLLVGGLLALPPWLGVLHEWPWIGAWLLTGLNLWITRGLHWDGWADLWDAWGSSARGERFWQIIKDSHIGAFGVLGLVLGLLGQAALFQAMLQHGAFGALVWCPLLGRSAVAGLALWCQGLGRPGMGRDFLDAAGWGSLAPVAAAFVLAGVLLVGWAATGAAALLLALFLWRLQRLARREGACNGDFLGAAVIAGELCAGLGWAFCM